MRLWSTGMALLIVPLLVSGGCRREPPPVSRQFLGETSLDDIRAALVLYAYQNTKAALRRENSVTCVAVEAAADPSIKLLTLLSGYGLNVRRASSCRLDDDQVVEMATGARGALVRVERLAVQQGRATAFASCQFAPHAGLGFETELDFRLGRWEIVRETSRLTY